ncbi:MAG: preprotein translocase subunit SecG [Nitrospirota bacterium]
MTTFLLIVHIMVCFFLIAIVLLQSGKGAEIGAAFGGSSQTLFGSRGAATFLSKMTTIAAVVFMITSLLLAILTTKGTSIVEKIPHQEEKSQLPSSGPVKTDTHPSQQQTPQKP